MALALLWLNMHRDKYNLRTWKGMPWDLLDNLYGEVVREADLPRCA